MPGRDRVSLEGKDPPIFALQLDMRLNKSPMNFKSDAQSEMLTIHVPSQAAHHRFEK